MGPKYAGCQTVVRSEDHEGPCQIGAFAYVLSDGMAEIRSVIRGRAAESGLLFSTYAPFSDVEREAPKRISMNGRRSPSVGCAGVDRTPSSNRREVEVKGTPAMDPEMTRVGRRDAMIRLAWRRGDHQVQRGWAWLVGLNGRSRRPVMPA